MADVHALALVYVMVFAQGALGYGLTSVMGAIVVEIFQGKQYGSIFGTHHGRSARGRRGGSAGHRRSA